MNQTVSDLWWMNAVRGVAGICLAGFLLISAQTGGENPLYGLAAYGVITGLALLLGGGACKRTKIALLLAVSGAVSTVAGIAPLFLAAAAVPQKLLFAAGGSVVVGVLDVIIAHGRGDAEQEPVLAFAGGVLIATGIVLLISGETPVTNLFRVMGVFMLLASLLLIRVAFVSRTRAPAEDGRIADRHSSYEHMA